jgi:hypothetical protein
VQHRTRVHLQQCLAHGCIPKAKVPVLVRQQLVDPRGCLAGEAPRVSTVRGPAPQPLLPARRAQHNRSPVTRQAHIRRGLGRTKSDPSSATAQTALPERVTVATFAQIPVMTATTALSRDERGRLPARVAGCRRLPLLGVAVGAQAGPIWLTCVDTGDPAAAHAGFGRRTTTGAPSAVFESIDRAPHLHGPAAPGTLASGFPAFLHVPQSAPPAGLLPAT